jgi:hypothetical protein
MSSRLESLLTPDQRAAANAADAISARRSSFDTLIAHIEAARSDAAGLCGRMRDMDVVHERLDALLCYARAECFVIGCDGGTE